MAVEGRREQEDAPDAGERADPAADRNQVAVHFADGTVATYAVVVRPRGDDWLYAERLVGDGDGFDDEEAESINADHVRRIRSDCVHRGDGGAVHHGTGLFVDPDSLLAARRPDDC